MPNKLHRWDIEVSAVSKLQRWQSVVISNEEEEAEEHHIITSKGGGGCYYYNDQFGNTRNTSQRVNNKAIDVCGRKSPSSSTACTSTYSSLTDVEIKVTCECCRLSEEYTLGYQEEIRRQFGGHWVCGLCAEAVREELRRRPGDGSSIEDALTAHMEPCKAAQSCPNAEDAAVPKAVCRLLRRHLSSPAHRESPRHPPQHTSSSLH